MSDALQPLRCGPYPSIPRPRRELPCMVNLIGSLSEEDRPSLTQVHSSCRTWRCAWTWRSRRSSVVAKLATNSLRAWDDTIATYPQDGGFALKGRHLRLGKIGNVSLKQHRPLEGTPKTCTVRRSATGKWYATISCEVEAKPLPESTQEMGIVGLEKFACLGQLSNPGKEEQELAKVSRKMEGPKAVPTIQGPQGCRPCP